MVWPDKVYFYADCSVNIAPDSATLAGIAVSIAETARAFAYQPPVTKLSFSTKGSTRLAIVDHDYSGEWPTFRAGLVLLAVRVIGERGGP